MSKPSTFVDPAPPLNAQARLRAPRTTHPFQVVLLEPEIPPNTGNVARLCAATQTRLHLVHPLGFDVDEKAVRRAGLDYWHLVDVHEHANLAALEAQREPGSKRYLFSGKAPRSFLEVDYRPGDYLVFGRESVGLPESLLTANPDEVVAIPTLGAVRSLNLSNAVALAVYEALRQNGMLEHARLEPLR